jgi:hypothetical protein
MRTSIFCTVLLFVASSGCGGGPADSPDTGPAPHDAASIDAGSADDAFVVHPDVGPRDDAGTTTVAGGDVSGTWCGVIEITGDVTVPAGQTLTVCAGAAVHVAAGVGIQVDGTLALPGVDGLRNTIDSPASFTGIAVNGTLNGAFVDLSGAAQAISGTASSTITLNDSTISGCDRTLALANGGTFDRTTITAGRTVTITGGVLRMTDSLLDLQHGPNPPDCTDWAGGGAVLDHVRFTGCHCPIHINSSSEEFTVTNSILDGSVNPVMIADSIAIFNFNNLIGVGVPGLVDDIGDRSGITCDVANNYWEGPVRVATGNHSQFTGEDVVLDAPSPGAGPR